MMISKIAKQNKKGKGNTHVNVEMKNVVPNEELKVQRKNVNTSTMEQEIRPSSKRTSG